MEASLLQTARPKAELRLRKAACISRRGSLKGRSRHVQPIPMLYTGQAHQTGWPSSPQRCKSNRYSCTVGSNPECRKRVCTFQPDINARHSFRAAHALQAIYFCVLHIMCCCRCVCHKHEPHVTQASAASNPLFPVTSYLEKQPQSFLIPEEDPGHKRKCINTVP